MVDWTIMGGIEELDVRGANLGPNAWPAAIGMIESGESSREAIIRQTLAMTDPDGGSDLVSDGSKSMRVVSHRFA